MKLLRRAALLPLDLLLLFLLGLLLLQLARRPQLGGNAPPVPGSPAWSSLQQRRRALGLDAPLLLDLRPWRAAERVPALLDAPPNELDAAQRLLDLGPWAVPALLDALEQPARSERAARVLDELSTLLDGAPPPGAPSAAWRAWCREHAELLHPRGTAALRRALLGGQLVQQLGRLLRLDLGRSLVDGQPVAPSLWRRLRVTLLYAAPTLLLAWLAGLALGAWGALRRGRPDDHLLAVLLYLLHALPLFVTASLLARWLAQGFAAPFPSGGLPRHPGAPLVDWARHLALPVLSFGLAGLPVLARVSRESFAAALEADYVLALRARGLPEWRVGLAALRNGLVPLTALAGSTLPLLVGGSVVVERIFNLPGLGSYLLDAVWQGDVNAALAVFLLVSALSLLGLFLADLAVYLLDPRARHAA